MKIKEVCEKTGLTDKAVRHYIREGLIFPKYDENYTGRKNFSFEDSDIERLQQVATLRKYGFSISRIKALLNCEQTARAVFNEHFEEARAEKEGSEKIFKRLNEISACEFGTAEELCLLLSESDYIPSDVPQNDNKAPYKLLYSKNKRARNILIALIVIITVFYAAVIGILLNGFFGSAVDTNTEIFVIDNQKYEIADKDWTLYTDSVFNGEYYLYNNNSGTVFAKEKDTELFDGIAYHNINDTYPNISMADKIDKIVCETANGENSLNNDIALLLCEELNKASGTTDIVDMSKSEVFINVYYNDYPAYQTEFMICFNKNGAPGVMLCETNRNTQAFGKNKMLLLSNEKLINYFSSIN